VYLYGSAREANELKEGKNQSAAFSKVKFFAVSVLLGYLMFWGVPSTIDWYRTGEWIWSGHYGVSHALYGLAVAWIFINLHHYLIDTLLWRRDNPAVVKYVFAQAV
jgi:hypothetical protein